jgi:hypothetical protein
LITAILASPSVALQDFGAEFAIGVENQEDFPTPIMIVGLVFLALAGKIFSEAFPGNGWGRTERALRRRNNSALASKLRSYV